MLLPPLLLLPPQEDVSVMMLERLGQFIGAEELALAQLVLGQFRW